MDTLTQGSVFFSSSSFKRVPELSSTEYTCADAAAPKLDFFFFFVGSY